MLLELGCNLSNVDRGERPVGAKFRSAASHPVIDTEPSEGGDVIIEKAVKAIIDSKGHVTLVEAVPDGSAGCGVHSSGRSTNTWRN